MIRPSQSPRIGECPNDPRDHTAGPMEHTREWLEDRGRMLRLGKNGRPGRVKAWRTIEHSLLARRSESSAPMSRQWLLEKTIGAHDQQVRNLEHAMRLEAGRAIEGIDEWLDANLLPPETHGVRINRDTFIDNDRIRSRVSVYVYRLT